MGIKFPLIFRNDHAREGLEKACVQNSSAVIAHNRENRSDSNISVGEWGSHCLHVRHNIKTVEMNEPKPHVPIRINARKKIMIRKHKLLSYVLNELYSKSHMLFGGNPHAYMERKSALAVKQWLPL